MTRSSGLENDANDANTTSAPYKNGLPSKAIGSVRSEHGTNEAPGLQRAHDVGAEIRPLDISGVLFRELIQSAGG